MKPALPYTPGGDAAGVVTAVGPGVSHVKVVLETYSGWRTREEWVFLCVWRAAGARVGGWGSKRLAELS